MVHQARLTQLAREAARITVQHVAGYERQRRHATLVAIGLDLGASLTDQAIDLFDRLVGAMFRRAESRQARAFQADARAINDKVRLYARVGKALIAARAGKHDAVGAITAVISWERFQISVAEAEALARPEEFDAYERIGEHYAAVRRWSPAFLNAFTFEGVPAAASLLRAIEVLRQANGGGSANLPGSAPTGFVRQRWAAYVLPGGVIDRRHYELCVLSELRDRLRAGDVWVRGRRQYRSFEERLISKQTLHDLQQAGTLPVAVEPDFERFIEARRRLLDARLTAVDARAKEDLLPDVTIERGVLKVAPIEKSRRFQRENVKALVPPPCPRTLDAAPIMTALIAAEKAIAGTTAVARLLPHPDLITRSLERREAVLSSQIEGTRTDLTQLLEYEATGSDEGLPYDAEVTLGYVRALDHGLRAVRREGGAQHLTLDLIRQLHRVLMSGAGYRHPEGPGEWRRAQNWIGARRIEDATMIPPPVSRLEACLLDMPAWPACSSGDAGRIGWASSWTGLSSLP